MTLDRDIWYVVHLDLVKAKSVAHGVDSPHELSSLPSPLCTQPNSDGSVYKMAYGDGLMFLLLKGTDKIPVPGSGSTTYNTTLSYFPFKAPYTLVDLPESTVSIPWNIGCEDLATDMGATAVANGKLYFLCSLRDNSKKKKGWKTQFFLSFFFATHVPPPSSSSYLVLERERAQFSPAHL